MREYRIESIVVSARAAIKRARTPEDAAAEARAEPGCRAVAVYDNATCEFLYAWPCFPWPSLDAPVLGDVATENAEQKATPGEPEATRGVVPQTSNE